MQVPDELDELRVSLEQIRTLLDTLVVRGLRACGRDELSQLGSYADHLSKSGAGHLASLLSDLKGQVERDERNSARTLLEAQTNVRLLERLLTLRVVKWQYAGALAAVSSEGLAVEDESGSDDEANEE
jgi:hypothetical protein